MASNDYTTNDSSAWDYIQPLAAPVANIIGSQVAGNVAASGNNQARAGAQAASAASTAALNPYATSGTAAEQELLGLYGLPGGTVTNPSAFENQPGYQWQVNQGDQGIQRGAAAAGGGFSASTLGALSSYNQGLASTTYAQYLQNLYALTSTGAGAANNLGANAIRASQISGDYQVGSAAARGAADTRTGVALGQGAAALAKMYGSGPTGSGSTGTPSGGDYTGAGPTPAPFYEYGPSYNPTDNSSGVGNGLGSGDINNGGFGTTTPAPFYDYSTDDSYGL